MSSSEPLVSVVTPFHNTGAYVAEAIESVLAQSYRNFEYLLIDNQSGDDSLAIAERYAQKDARIRVIRTPTLLNQVANYNFAIEQIASPRYLKVVQADDWIFPRCLTEMVALAEAHPNVGVVSAYELHGTEVRCQGLPPETRVMPGRDACRLHLLQKTFLFGTPTTVLYCGERVRLRRPFYAEGRLHEDTDAVYEILADSEFGFVHQVLSFSRTQAGAISEATRGFHALDWLITVKSFGARFLDPAELAETEAEAYRWYYRSLVEWCLKSLPRGPTEKFWEYQRRGLASIGERFDASLIARHLTTVAVEQALEPLRVARAAKRILSRAKSKLGGHAGRG